MNKFTRRNKSEQVFRKDKSEQEGIKVNKFSGRNESEQAARLPRGGAGERGE